MSNTDSFINEVSEEVQRDRLFALLRRYGWIAVVVVIALVGGTAWTSIQAERKEAAARDLGDQILVALEAGDSTAQLAALETVQVDGPASAVTAFLKANVAVAADDAAAGLAGLDALATNGDIPEIYRQIAAFRALQLRGTSGPAQATIDERRIGYEALAIPGNPLRLLAEEQLALIDLEAGDTSAAIDRLNAILIDAEVTDGLAQRARELILVLGGEQTPVLENQ